MEVRRRFSEIYFVDESDTAGKGAPSGAAASSQVGLVVGCWLL